jgi:hypothetical protein
MGYVNGGIPQDIVKELSKKGKISLFVETGTSIGGTAIWASELFKKVYTIEIMPEISKEAVKRAGNIKNINFLIGDSNKELGQILPELENNTLFWLDGHYSGPGTGGVDNECPVMNEIEIISKCKDACILIDDARCFFGPPPRPHNAKHWPGITEIFRQLEKYFPTHYITVVDDVIFCIPAPLKKVLDEDWYKNFGKRFPGKQNTLLKKIYSRIKA